MSTRHSRAPFVVSFTASHQQEAVNLILNIQNVEAGLDISLDDQPDLVDIERSYLSAGGAFWVALDEQEKVVGTIGLMIQTPEVAVLKKFFVAVDWRGKDKDCASRLYESLIAFARSRGLTTIVLDTPSSAARSHTFYRRHGFEQISGSELPVQYDYPDRGSLLFRLRLTE